LTRGKQTSNVSAAQSVGGRSYLSTKDKIKASPKPSAGYVAPK